MLYLVRLGLALSALSAAASAQSYLPAIEFAQGSKPSPRTTRPAAPPAAPAPIEFSGDAAEGLRLTGVDVEATLDVGRSYIDLTLRLADFENAIPLLRRSGVFSRDRTDDEIRRRRYTAGIGYLNQASTFVIMTVYRENRNLDRAIFRAFITHDNEFGQLTTEQVFSFEFNRAIHGQVNWQNFRANNLPRVARSFLVYAVRQREA